MYRIAPQIFVGDVYGAFQGLGLGAFSDMGCLTMFADYRVPVVLQVFGILEYSEDLEAAIRSRQEVAAGSEMECQIRAASIVAVERIRQRLQNKLAKELEDSAQTAPSPEFEQPATSSKSTDAANSSAQQQQQQQQDAGLPSCRRGNGLHNAPQVLSIHIDWYLWELGERNMRAHPPHHRTLTVYY